MTQPQTQIVPSTAAGAPLALTQPSHNETAGMVLASQAKALVEARYTIALRQPRDIDNVRAKLLKECARPSFAEVAVYRKPVGEGIEGPSIRLAEAAAQAMGNVLVDTPTIYDDHEKRIVRVSVADMEANLAYTKDVTVRKAVERRRAKPGDTILRQRQNSRGDTVFLLEATDDEILNTENALVSKCLRTLLLRIVPGWLIEECIEAVYATRAAATKADPDAAKNKLFDAFRGKGVQVEQIKTYLGHDASVLQPRELLELRSLYTAITDGETTWREVMDAKDAKDAKPAKETSAAVGGNAAVKAQIAAAKELAKDVANKA